MKSSHRTHFACDSKRILAQSGMTLVELLVSMVVFLVVSAGVAGTLTAGLKTTANARQSTIGKAVAQEQIEEMKARVFHVPYSNNTDTGTTADIDILDRYFPDLVTQATTDEEGWQGWYTYSGDDAYYTKIKPEDEKGITSTIVTRFVDDSGNTVIPQSTYDSNIEGNDTPPNNLISISVTTSWNEAGRERNFELNTIISSTGQTVQGAGDSSGEEGCNSNSNNFIDVFGATFNISTGATEPYTAFIDGNFGEGHASFSTGCETQITGSGTGGKIIVDANTSTGANVSVAGPPSNEENSGPSDYSQTSLWPQWTISSSKVEGEAETDEDELEGEGEASVGAMAISLQQVDGWPGGTVNGYKYWDILNPVVQVIGGVDSEEEDSDHQDDQAEAEIKQEDDAIQGEGEVHYQQINILPLQAKTSSTPSALQGLIFIRSFKSEVKGQVDGVNGETPDVTYRARVYMFNQSKSSSCSGDGCYDYYDISGSQNAATTIQSAINLNSSKYRLQKELFAEMTSATKQEINNAITYAAEGTSATFNLDALLKISVKFGTEVRMKSSSPYTVDIISPQGLMQIYLGSINMSLSTG